MRPFFLDLKKSSKKSVREGKSILSKLQEVQGKVQTDQGWVIEVIWGYDIKVNKNWIPYVEISQEDEVVIDEDKEDNSEIYYSEMNVYTDSLAKISNSWAKSSKATFDGLMHEELKDNKVTFSTPIK